MAQDKLVLATLTFQLLCTASMQRSDLFAQSTPIENVQIRVVLFGQPCVLSGPHSKKTLETIHAISPEKLPQAFSLESALELRSKLRKSATPPIELKDYRDSFSRYLESSITYYQNLKKLKKNRKVSNFLNALKPYITSKSLPEIKALAKKLVLEPKNVHLVDQLTDQFREVSPPYPESEFHRAIKKIQINYNCSFDEGE